MPLQNMNRNGTLFESLIILSLREGFKPILVCSTTAIKWLKEWNCAYVKQKQMQPIKYFLFEKFLYILFKLTGKLKTCFNSVYLFI